MPSITDSDETDQLLNQQRRDRHEQCNAMSATQMLTAATIQRSVKEAMRETLSELKDDILAPMAQRIMNLEEGVDKIEKRIETESTTKRTEPKQHDSEIARLNKQIETISQEMKKLPTQLKTTTTPEKNNNLVIVGNDEEEGENTHAKIEALARTLKCELTYFQASRLGSTTKRQAGTSGNKSRSRPILVQFATTWERRKLYACREKIRSSEDTNLQKIFISEDLSKEQAAVFFLARKSKKLKLVFNAWTYQGTVHISRESKGTPIPISTKQDLLEQVPELKTGDQLTLN